MFIAGYELDSDRLTLRNMKRRLLIVCKITASVRYPMMPGLSNVALNEKYNVRHQLNQGLPHLGMGFLGIQ